MLGSPPLVRHGPASLVPARARPQLVSPALGRQRCNQRSGLKIGPAWSRSPHPVRVNLDHPLKSNSQASRSEGCKRSSSPGNPNLNSTSFILCCTFLSADSVTNLQSNQVNISIARTYVRMFYTLVFFFIHLFRKWTSDGPMLPDHQL